MGKITYITPSFYSSVYYWRNREDGEVQELLDLIDKKPVETTELMQAGIDFEDEVLKVCNGGYVSDDQVANDVANIVNGCLWQVPVECEVQQGSEKIKVFGRMDCIKRDWIYDIKCVTRYDIGKYQNSIQHLAYMKATGINKMKYLVNCGNTLYTEEYRGDETNKNLLAERAFDLINWLKNIGLYERYLQKWEIKK